MPDVSPLEYEVTVFDHQVAFSVLNEVRVSRYGATCILKEFAKLPYAEVSEIMVRMSQGSTLLYVFEGHPDDDNPYTINVVKKAPELCNVCGRVKDAHHI